jgi:hypothetical protein
MSPCPGTSYLMMRFSGISSGIVMLISCVHTQEQCGEVDETFNCIQYRYHPTPPRPLFFKARRLVCTLCILPPSPAPSPLTPPEHRQQAAGGQRRHELWRCWVHTTWLACNRRTLEAPRPNEGRRSGEGGEDQEEVRRKGRTRGLSVSSSKGLAA